MPGGVPILRGAPAAPCALAALLLLLGPGCGERREAVPPGRPVEAPSPDYASSDACRSCHPAQYASWNASFHRSMTEVATPRTVHGDFEGEPPRAGGRAVRLRREGERFLAHVPDPLWKGDGEPRFVERPIALVTGRHHLQIYWYETGHSRVLGRLPVAWDMRDRSWLPVDANFIMPPHATQTALVPPRLGTWNYGCIQCHATDPRPHWGGLDYTRTEVSEFGIACEACHGPARAHALARRDPATRYAEHLGGAAAPDVVNPRRLTHARGSEVCGRCHSAWGFASNEEYARFTQEGMRYRPGDVLEESGIRLYRRHSVDPGSFWPDDVVKPTGREYDGLLSSPCFQAGEMTCFSCHQMHAGGSPEQIEAWRDDQLAPGMRGDRACLQCHERFRPVAAREAHTHHRPGTPGSACQDCHMPYQQLGLRKAERSHTIRSPSAANDQATGRPNACNLCHLDRPLGFTARALAEWTGQPPPALDAIERHVPAAVVDALRGDAAQRALAAWAMGWEPAVATARGERFVPAVLANLLDDPYPAVRYHAQRSLRRLPGWADFEYDWIGPAAERRAAVERALRRWMAQRREQGAPPRLDFLLGDGGREVGRDVFARLLRERDDRPVVVRE